MCMLESDAKQMIQQKTAEIHSLIDYINSKDDLKKYEDIIYGINLQEIQTNHNRTMTSKVRLIRTEIGTL